MAGSVSRYSLIIIVFLAIPLTVQAQELDIRRMLSPDPAEAVSAAPRMPGIYESLPVDANLRYRNLSPTSVTGVTPASLTRALGQRIGFNTHTLFFSGWTVRDFLAVDTSATFNLWVETAELNNFNVTTVDIDSLAMYLSSTTPDESIDPTKGILENTVTTFGDLPNSDGDGILDILWYDIRDDYPSTPNFIDHMVLPEDLDPQAPDSVGNHRDVIYIDTNPLLVDFDTGASNVARVASVSVQELIHLGKDLDESRFLVSGLSNYAPIVNGFTGPGHEYLLFPGEHNISMFSWSGLLGDVQRATQLVTYIVDQLGIGALAELTADTTNEIASVSNLLTSDGRTADEFILDFHTANLVNDTSVDERWGYSSPDRGPSQVAPTLRVDGSFGSSATTQPEGLAPGGVLYFQIDNVEDVTLEMAATNGGQQGLLAGRFYGVNVNGTTTVTEMDVTGTATLVGRYDEVFFIATSAASVNDTVSVVMDASWTGTAYPTTNVIYDPGATALTGPNFFELGPDFKQATFFEHPADQFPVRLDVAPFFKNQFVNSSTGEPNGSPSDPRDFTVCIATPAFDGNPGECVVEETYADPRPFSMVSASNPSIQFFSIDLLDYAEQLEGIQDMFVVFSEAGVDDNILVMGLSEYSVENVSYVYGPIGPTDWYRLWDITAGGGSLSNRVIPIRAQFQNRPVIVGVDHPDIDVSTARLSPNFPNPFSSQTTIEFHLSHTSSVRLEIFDLLGRRVRSLADGLYPQGAHTVTVDAGELASGLYLYRLDAGGTLYTRSMVLNR